MILAILQARVSSSRLPNKVLKPILGLPMLTRQIERIKRAKMINNILIATSDDASDNPIKELCRLNGVTCFRGQLNDVLDRFYQAARLHFPTHIVRLTGDCPLADPILIDQVIDFCLSGNFDYVSNALDPTYPDGLDVEVFRFSCLEAAWKESKLPSQREHVTSFIYLKPFRFKIGSYKNYTDLSYLRWTVDEQLDFDLILKIYKYLYSINSNFCTQDILDFLEINPDLKTFNTCYQRNQGFQKSLLEDEIFMAKTNEV